MGQFGRFDPLFGLNSKGGLKTALLTNTEKTMTFHVFLRPGLYFSISLVLAALFSVGGGERNAQALEPAISSAYGGGYYHYENASPAYRHGVKTPFNSYPKMPQIPTVPMPTLPVVPVPTMADLLPNPQNAEHPYIGVNGIGYYSDEVMEEYDPQRYRNPNPNHQNRHHRATDNPQEIPDSYRTDKGYSDAESDHDAMNDLTGELAGSTDKKPQKSSHSKKSSKKSKKTSPPDNSIR